MLGEIPEEAVCKICGCRDAHPLADRDRCAGCEAMIDLGDAFACCPRSHSSLLNRIRWILYHYWQRVGVLRPEPGIVAPRPGDTVVINGRERIVPDPPSSSGEEEKERDCDLVYLHDAAALPFGAAPPPEEGSSTTPASAQGQFTQFAHENREAGDGGTPGLVLGWHSSLSLAVAFNAAFNLRDPCGTGLIDTEDVKELLRDFDIEPGRGAWVLNQFGVRGSTWLSYDEVLLLVQDVMSLMRGRRPQASRMRPQATDTDE